LKIGIKVESRRRKQKFEIGIQKTSEETLSVCKEADMSGISEKQIL